MVFGASMVKYILFLINKLFSIYGVLLMVFGALLFNNTGEYRNLQEAVQTHQIPIGLIVLGSVVLVISILECCVAIRDSYCMSIIYAVMLLVLLIVHLVCVVYFWVNFWENFVNSMGKVVDKAWKERTLQADFMHAIEVGFKCCGKNGPTDYLITFSMLPSTCCEKNDCTSPLEVYTTGCKRRFTNFWTENSDLFRFAGLVIVGIKLVAFIFDFLASNIRNYKRRPDYKIVLNSLKISETP